MSSKTKKMEVKCNNCEEVYDLSTCPRCSMAVNELLIVNEQGRREQRCEGCNKLLHKDAELKCRTTGCGNLISILSLMTVPKSIRRAQTFLWWK